MGFKAKLKITVKKIWAKHSWKVQVKNAVAEAKKVCVSA